MAFHYFPVICKIIFPCCDFKFLQRILFCKDKKEASILLMIIFHIFLTVLISQIELVHAQFKRAKAQTEFLDLKLDLDIAVAQIDKDPDPVILKRLSEKLHLRSCI
ncbi:hypothetical protein MtrunA17_Chr1g0198971 [Medicago truncatula]|uniref:Transmembrane protein n=1 Tax=Medicago truncatula TaxID=3880 RepID=A0A396JSY9_MEDTR|nr:hypothetical protein MtrunA17_Chr1g0198971 [Medicago truncatula]